MKKYEIDNKEIDDKQLLYDFYEDIKTWDYVKDQLNKETLIKKLKFKEKVFCKFLDTIHKELTVQSPKLYKIKIFKTLS